MRIEACIDALVSYAMNRGLAEPVDHQVLTNRLLDLLHLDENGTLERDAVSGAAGYTVLLTFPRKSLLRIMQSAK